MGVSKYLNSHGFWLLSIAVAYLVDFALMLIFVFSGVDVSVHFKVIIFMMASPFLLVLISFFAWFLTEGYRA